MNGRTIGPFGLKNGWTERRVQWTIFIAMLLVRVMFFLVTHGTSLAPDNDWERYDEQSNGILAGDFDLEVKLFIGSPVYPYLQALFKWIFGGAWFPALSALIILMSAFSGVVLYRIANFLFDRRVALLTAMVYCVLPTTLIWVNSRSQEMPFMALLIFFIHALLLAIHEPSYRRTLVAAVLFSLTFLTKSHILLFAPFIPLYWWRNMPGPVHVRSTHIAMFIGISLLSTLPHGLYNLDRHGIYVISSTGLGGHFLTGHNEDVYRFIVDPPPFGSPEHTRIHAMEYGVLHELADTLRVLPHKGDQQVFLNKGLEWCMENPGKFVKLTLYDLYYFLLPGVNYHHYSTGYWAVLFVISFPLYMLAYLGIFKAMRIYPRKHAWVVWLVIAVMLLSCVFYVQNRFRSITLEPFYIIYASYGVLWLTNRKERSSV